MTVTLTPLAVQPKTPAGGPLDPRCGILEDGAACTAAATHVRIVAPTPPAFHLRQPAAELVCAVHAHLVPGLDAVVADANGHLGVVVTNHFPNWRDFPQVSVEWETGTVDSVLTSDLLFTRGACERCGDETLPGQTACPLHGGRTFV